MVGSIHQPPTAGAAGRRPAVGGIASEQQKQRPALQFCACARARRDLAAKILPPSRSLPSMSPSTSAALAADRKAWSFARSRFARQLHKSAMSEARMRAREARLQQARIGHLRELELACRRSDGRIPSPRA